MSEGPVAKLTACFCGTVCTVVIIALLTALPIAHIVIGHLYMDSCPLEEKIPLYLLVAGAVGLAQAVLRSLSACLKHRGERDGQQQPRSGPGLCVSLLEGVTSLFLACWFIAGNVWTYQNYSIVQWVNATQNATYCAEVVYQFSFWSITGVYILLAVGIVIAILVCCCACCCAACKK